MTLVRNETQRHSAALKSAGQNPISLLPLDGVGSAVPSLQLHPVFGIDTERVPPNDAMSRFVGFGDKSWDNLKNFFQTQGFEFLFLSQSARRVAFGGSMAPKTPVLKLNRPFARKPPASAVSKYDNLASVPVLGRRLFLCRFTPFHLRFRHLLPAFQDGKARGGIRRNGSKNLSQVSRRSPPSRMHATEHMPGNPLHGASERIICSSLISTNVTKGLPLVIFHSNGSGTLRRRGSAGDIFSTPKTRRW